MANRWGIPKEVEEIVRKRDNSCVYCGARFIKNNSSRKNKPSWEHIINDIRITGSDNIALCCMSCNASKGSKLLEEWLESDYCKKKQISVDSVAKVVKMAIQNPPSLPDKKPSEGGGETTVDCPMCSCPKIDISGIKDNDKVFCIYENLIKTAATEYNPLVTSFLMNFSDDLSINPDDIIFELEPLNGYGECDASGDKYVITLNSNEIDNRAPIEIAKTFIHEILHANLLYKFDKKEEEYKVLLNMFYETQISSENDLHHTYFADNLIPVIQGNLFEWCRQSGLAVSLDYCEKMSWAGLDGISEYENNPDKNEIENININEKTNNTYAKGRNCN